MEYSPLHLLYFGGSAASATNVTVTSWPSDNFTFIVSSLKDFLSLVSNSFPDPVISPLRTPPVIFQKNLFGRGGTRLPCSLGL